MTSIERTAHPESKRLTLARVLYVFFTPAAEEVAWARERTASPEALLALVLDLKRFQKMARVRSRGGDPRGRHRPRAALPGPGAGVAPEMADSYHPAKKQRLASRPGNGGRVGLDCLVLLRVSVHVG